MTSAEQAVGDPTDVDFAGGSPLVTQDDDTTPVVSVVLPTMNEEAGIAECIRRIQRVLSEIGVTGEIIVSDSSDDRTPEIAREMGAVVVTPDRLGYGYAYRYAFDRVRGDYVVMGDADTTYDFEELPALIERLQETDADIVIGSRLDGEIRPGAMPALHQYVGNPALTAFLNLFYDAGVSDAHSGFRVLTREALEAMDLDSDGMEFASEMVMEASTRGLAIKEVPITYHEREGEATLDSFRDGWRHVEFMLVNAPGYLFSVPGLLLAAVGTVIMTLGLLGAEVAGQPIGIHSTIAGSLLLIASYQVASFGLLTDIAADPIRSPEDPITQWIHQHVDLHRGLLIGSGLFTAGVGSAGWLLYRWVESGYRVLPSLSGDIVAFTLIVLGLQTISLAFFGSILADHS